MGRKFIRVTKYILLNHPNVDICRADEVDLHGEIIPGFWYIMTRKTSTYYWTSKREWHWHTPKQFKTVSGAVNATRTQSFIRETELLNGKPQA